MRRKFGIGRLRLCWWGHFWRGWLQFGKGWRICADKDYNVSGRSFFIGPIEIQWWCRPDWQDFCFTQEEADAFDADIRRSFPHSGPEKP